MQGAAIVGNLGNFPEIRYTQSGKAVANVTVYENHPNSSDGTPRPSTRHQVTLWEDLAINANRSLQKGDEVVVVVAKTEPNEYINSQGTKVVGTTITARTIALSLRWSDIKRVKNAERSTTRSSRNDFDVDLPM